MGETPAKPVAEPSSTKRGNARGSLLRRVFLPNQVLEKPFLLMVAAFWAAIALIVWSASPWASLPGPGEVVRAFGTLWWQQGMGPELYATVKLILHATVLTVIISMLLSYASILAFSRPLVEAVSKLRFLGITGLVFPFTLLTGGGYSLKVWLLTFGMSTFFVTAMAQAVLEIPREQFDYMRVLGAGELRIFWEVVVRGTLDKALDALRQNLAMGWAMITMVEGISRAEGGVGALILNQNKHFHLAEVYAVLIAILVVGLLLDYVMAVAVRVICPHVILQRVRR
jgi:NitT/TauT family transport system permease protein